MRRRTRITTAKSGAVELRLGFGNPARAAMPEPGGWDPPAEWDQNDLEEDELHYWRFELDKSGRVLLLGYS